MRTSRRRPRAFTLVELLVVVGLIALLIGVLLPSLGKAREAANRTKCLSNVRQVTIALFMYVNDNGGHFPAVSRWNGSASLAGSLENDADFLYWEQPAKYWFRVAEQAPAVPRNAQDDQNRGSIVKYMGRSFSPAVWTCPDDDPRTHRIVGGTTDLRYPYSYTMNYMFDAGLAGGPLTWIGGVPMKMARVRHAYDCILVMEEGSTTINDGCTVTQAISGGVRGQQTTGVTAGMDLAAVRHGSMGRAIHLPDTAYLPAAGDFDNVPNPQGMSNVGFCDGHAATVTRDFVHSPSLGHWDPLR